MGTKSKPLTPRQQRFVDEYLLDLNASQAAQRAGYSRRTADRQGHRLLRNAEVAAAVRAAQKERSDRVEVKSDEVLRGILAIALFDIGEIYDEDGKLRPIGDLPPEVRAAIASIETVELPDGAGVTRKFRAWDKLKALELLGKHPGLFVDRIEHSADVSFAVALKEARERAARRTSEVATR